MAGWMVRCAKVLEPLYDAMRDKILGYDIVLNDDTPVTMLTPGKGGRTTTRLWASIGGENAQYTLYNFTTGRSRAGPNTFFEQYSGYIVSDAYAGYEELYRRKDIHNIACWTHARRYFKEAQKSEPRKATEILTLIARLYKIEQKAKTLSADDCLALRRTDSRKQLAKIFLWLRAHCHAFLPKSPMNTAIQYTLKLRSRLTRYTRDGRLPIDNNLAENAIRPVALGRKNWLFVGSEDGGHTAATLMSFTTTCRKLRINTWAYLKDVLTRINDHPMSKIHDLLPDRWQADHNAS
jgi:hypothetical protein